MVASTKIVWYVGVDPYQSLDGSYIVENNSNSYGDMQNF